jgi:hypothetical protein
MISATATGKNAWRAATSVPLCRPHRCPPSLPGGVTPPAVATAAHNSLPADLVAGRLLCGMGAQQPLKLRLVMPPSQRHMVVPTRGLGPPQASKRQPSQGKSAQPQPTGRAASDAPISAKARGQSGGRGPGDSTSCPALEVGAVVGHKPHPPVEESLSLAGHAQRNPQGHAVSGAAAAPPWPPPRRNQTTPNSLGPASGNTASAA